MITSCSDLCHSCLNTIADRDASTSPLSLRLITGVRNSETRSCAEANRDSAPSICRTAMLSLH